MDFLGMEKGPSVGLQQHLQAVSREKVNASGAEARAARLSADYEKLMAMFQAEVEAHKLTKAALMARVDQINFIFDNGVDVAMARTAAKYRDGKQKGKSRVIFEEAMKKHGLALGLALNRVLKYLDT